MGIRKPKVTVDQARRMSVRQSLDTEKSKVSRLGKTRATEVSSETDSARAEHLVPERNAHDAPEISVESASAIERTPPASAKPSDDPHPFKAGPIAEQGSHQLAKQQIFLSAIIPLNGVSKSFDQLSRYYQPAKALQMVLRRAMSDYEVMIANGSFKKASSGYAVPEKPTDQVMVQTSRVMPTEIAELARNHFDPLGFESTRAFGHKLAMSALAAFFERENSAN